MVEYFRIPRNITSFMQIEIPVNITHVYCSDRNFTSFIGCPNHITYLDIDNNQITSFEHLPNSIQRLYCSYNQITSFEHLPNSITHLTCHENPCYSIYQELGLNGIHEQNNILDIKEPEYD